MVCPIFQKVHFIQRCIITTGSEKNQEHENFTRQKSCSTFFHLIYKRKSIRVKWFFMFQRGQMRNPMSNFTFQAASKICYSD